MNKQSKPNFSFNKQSRELCACFVLYHPNVKITGYLGDKMWRRNVVPREKNQAEAKSVVR